MTLIPFPFTKGDKHDTQEYITRTPNCQAPTPGLAKGSSNSTTTGLTRALAARNRDGDSVITHVGLDRQGDLKSPTWPGP